MIDEEGVDETSVRYTLPEHPGTVSGVACSPDGGMFATACTDGMVRFWSADDGKPSSVADWQIGPLGSIAFSPDRHLCGAGTLEGRVLIWDRE
jgi:WD40 repeat protein